MMGSSISGKGRIGDLGLGSPMSKWDNDESTIQLTIHWVHRLQATRPPSPAGAYKNLVTTAQRTDPWYWGQEALPVSDIAYSQGTAQGSSPESSTQTPADDLSHQKAEESLEQKRNDLEERDSSVRKNWTNKIIVKRIQSWNKDHIFLIYKNSENNKVYKWKMIAKNKMLKSH